MMKEFLLLAAALALLGCVSAGAGQANGNAPEATATAPAASAPAPTLETSRNCFLTSYEKLSVGASECELSFGYPAYKPPASECGTLEKPSGPLDITGPPSTGNLVRCTDGGLVHEPCCDSLKTVWGDGSCTVTRLYCLGSHGNPEQRRPGGGHVARCASCEDLCSGECVDGACHRTETPGTWAVRVDCGTLEEI